ncbi:SurA N-terminal domain-containing protein [Sphingobacterium sp. SRCM116780]|uniref:SurA N-terminal domain-containing protein n=1 Tax=Sphingobacterium sp. SRCM116780 TaxID=2907623 RepID=UPI001F1D725A|nr:SurA N-terminal domain-containing protein [Sphingobacterium sp. SRCM116780]UIR55313.1 SurA N-terminal domain-containing protein [Sphingobacterium sp. SRCM116780]
MGLMSFLRNRAGYILTGAMAVAILAFLLGDVVKSGTPFWAKNQNRVGEINGEKIDYQEFNQQVDQTAEMFKQQMGGGNLTPQMKSYAVQQVWNQLLQKEILKGEIEKIGLDVSKNELNDLVTGKNPSNQIVQAFSNPQTGQFDRNQLLTFISQVNTSGNAQAAQQWEMLLAAVKEERLNSKYSSLLNNSVYVTSLEANDEYQQRNKLANFNYLLLDYASVKDNEIKVTDADYQAYYDEHKNSFKNQEETRSIEYAVVDARPTAKDINFAKETINKLKTELATAANDSLFASINSDNKYPYAFVKKGQLSPALDSVVFNAPAGSIVGPFESNGTLEIAKVVQTTVGPDSVKASHILLNPTAEGGVQKALAKADSIKGLLAKGEKFSTLAVQFSTDEASKVNGGELGTLTRGRMPAVIEDAIFNSKTGDIKIVESQYGVQIIKIENSIGSTKYVKAAIVDKAIISGKETLNNAHSKANAFLTVATAQNFAQEAQKLGLKTTTASRVLAMDNTLDGNEAPRELIKWAFDAKKGDISDRVFETEQSYILARLVDVQPKGIVPLESIKKDIEVAVKNTVKAKLLKEKMNAALSGASSLAQVGQKLGKTPVAVENIVLANPVIPGVSQENKVVGTVFGLQPNKPSKAIEGTQGIFAVQVNAFVNPAAIPDLNEQKKQILASKTQRAWASIFRALQDKAEITDNRVKFF